MAVALLTLGFLLASAIAVVEFVQLRAARERIEELEGARDDGEGGGGLLDDLLGDLLPDEANDALSTLECVGGLGFGGGGGGEDQSIAGIAREVERIRDLRFEEVPVPRFLSGEETSRRVRELFLEEYTPELADIEERVLLALGAIPPGTDLRELRAEVLGGQVAGFYEPETGELVVRRAGGEISATDRITLAHELDHALTDQALDIPLPDDVELGTEDRTMATLALVEGDATLVMQRYSSGLGLEEQLEALDPGAVAEAEAGLAGLPPYLRKELLFPYQEGLEFVCDLYADGGWKAVDRAYADPPTTTAQILFPERYGEAAEDPRDPSRPGRGWRELARLELGAANLLWLFQAPGGAEGRPGVADPMAAAGAWAGGEMVLWGDGPETAVGIALAERDGADELCAAVTEWYGSSFQGDREQGAPDGRFLADGERQDAVITCAADEVRVGIAPDLRTAGRMAG